MNRIDRLSAILIQLQSRRVVRAQDIADRFNISLRTVYRDIKALEEGGIPLIGEAGVGYSLSDGYRLPPVMFTREEAMAFLTAEKLIDKLTDAASGANYRSAMYKIKAVLRSSEKDFLEAMDKNIEVLKSRPQEENNTRPDMLKRILESIAARQVLDIKYFTHYRQEHTSRKIEPVGVFYLDNYWHLIAFCRMRNDYRDFRLDRIMSLVQNDEMYHRVHPSLKEFTARLYECSDLRAVVIKVQKSKALYLGDQKYYHGFLSQRESDDYLEMSFLCPSLEGFARWFLMFGDCASVIEPSDLKTKVKEIASSIVEKC